MGKPLTALCMIILATCAAACSRQDETASTQKTPAPQTAAQENSIGARIISASPAATLQLVEMGAVDHLVGVSQFDVVHLPEDKKNLPTVGDYLNFDYEKLLLLKPTHVVVQMASDRLAPRLKEITEKNHIALVNIQLNTLDDLFTTAETLGTIADVQDRARIMISLARAKLSSVEKKTSQMTPPRTLWIMGKKPIFVVGKDGLWDQLLKIAGANNMGVQIGESYFPQISNETLIAMKPEVLLIASPDEPDSQGPNDPRLRQWMALPIPAAKMGRVHLLTDGGMLMGSLAIGDNAITLARIIHPELKDWSPEEDEAPR